MARLPTYDAQRGLDVGSAQRVSVDTSGLAAANDIGNALSQAGSVGAAIVKRRQQQEEQKADFKTAQGYQQMLLNLGNDYDQFLEASPEDGTGFHDRLMRDGFQRRTQEFLASVPERSRARYEDVLQTDFLKWSSNAAKAERDRLYENSERVIGEQQNTFLNAISLDAGQYDDSLQSGLAIIDASPLPEALKAEARRDWEATALNALASRMIQDDPEAARKALGGGSQLDFSASVNTAIDTAAARHGQSAHALRVIAHLESGGNPNAKNKDSTAAGLFQFVDGTAKEYGLTNRYDATQSADAAARLMRNNRNQLNQALGREPTIGELYLAHQQGAAGAIKLLSNPNAKAVDLVGHGAVKLNRGTPDMTAGEFANLWITKAEKVAGGKEKIDPAFANMSIVDRMKLLSVAERAVGDEQKNITQQLASLKGEIELRLATDDPTLTQEEILSSGLKASDQAALINKLNASRKDERAAAEFAARVQSESAQFDPFSSEDRKGVDLLFESSFSDKSVLDNADAAKNALYLFEQTQIVPKQAVNQLRKGAGSTEPSQVLSAARIAMAIADGGVDAFSHRSGGKAIDDLNGRFRYLTGDLGYTDEEAAAQIAASNNPEVRRRNEALVKSDSIADELKSIDAGMITNQLDAGILDVEPSFPNDRLAAVAVSEYRDLFKEEIVRADGDVDLAHEMAKQRFTRIYNVSQLSILGENTVMRHPVETSYPPINGSHDWVKDQAIAVLETNDELPEPRTDQDGAKYYPAFHAHVQALDEEKSREPSVFIEPDDQTDRQIKAGQAPSYRIYYFDGEQTQLSQHRFTPNTAAAFNADVARRMAERQELATGISGSRSEASLKGSGERITEIQENIRRAAEGDLDE